MTWTVFEHNAGHNETTDLAPGRGGYTYVMVPTDIDTATKWWDARFGNHPGIERPISEYGKREQFDNGWVAEQFDDGDDARCAAGEKTLTKGGIGVPKTAPFSWSELRGRLDVWVVDAEMVNTDLEESDEWSVQIEYDSAE